MLKVRQMWLSSYRQNWEKPAKRSPIPLDSVKKSLTTRPFRNSISHIMEGLAYATPPFFDPVDSCPKMFEFTKASPKSVDGHTCFKYYYRKCFTFNARCFAFKS